VRDVSTREEKKNLFLARATSLSLSLSLSLDQNFFFSFSSSHHHTRGWNNEKVKSFENLKFLVVLYEQSTLNQARE
jgi:hypothetical protein